MTVELVLLTRVSYRGQEITRPLVRNLLALLAGEPRAGCGTARLVAELWPDAQPAHPAKALQVLVSQARAQLGAELIAGTPTGYRLALDEQQIDACAIVARASAAARDSRAGDHAAVLAHADAGLALWPGAPGVGTGVPADPPAALRDARATTHRALRRARALALARLGRRAEALEPLTELFGEHPRDEELLAELLRCEAATMGPSTALASYDVYRRALRDELGSDPGPGLRAVHEELLRHEAPPVRHGVRHEPNPLLGRDDDIAAVTGLLHSARVVSVVGAGGLGKTRLAHVVGRQAPQRVVCLVGLAGVTADEDVAAEVASALGIGELGRGLAGRTAVPADVRTAILGALGPGPALLVLDNCEHVVAGAAELVAALVAMSGDLRVLTTSRAPLGLSSEVVYPLPELSLPTAVLLFEQRARAARPGVELPLEAVRGLCGQLDGLPLAVELAAARVRVRSVAEIAALLDDRFALLRGGARDAPARHRTLHAVIDWSWNLLTPAEQAAMRALSVFPGGFTADAAAYLLGDGDGDRAGGDVLGVVDGLAGQSLLKVVDTGPGTRCRMLETVREFSTAHRAAAGENDRVTEGFLRWAREFGTAHHDAVFAADPMPSVDAVRAEQDNLVHALRLALERADGSTVAAVSAVLSALWTIESNFTRAGTLVEQTAWLLSHVRPGPEFVEVTRTAAVLGAVNSFLLRRPAAARCMLTLRRLPTAPPDTPIRALEIVLRAAAGTPDPRLRALRRLCDSDEPLLAGLAHGVASYVWENRNDLDGALDAARRMLAAVRGRVAPWIATVAHGRIGELCLQLDRGEEARTELRATLPVLTGLGERSGVARAWWALVMADLQLGDVDEAERSLEQALRQGGAESAGVAVFDVCARAEILLARGDVDGGLRAWRRAARRLRDWPDRTGEDDQRGMRSWSWEVRAVTVVAHAWHGRLDLVEDIVGELPGLLAEVLTALAGVPGESFAGFPLCGAMLLAVATVDVDRAERTTDARTSASGARLVALAERFRFLREFQPTMSVRRVRELARRADGPAYADAVSSYAGLGRQALLAAASELLRAREQVTLADRG